MAPIGWTGPIGNGSSNNAPLVFSFATVNGWLLNSSMGDLTVMFLPGTYLISDTVNPGSAHHRFVIGGDGNRVVRLIGVADSAGNWPKMVLAPKPVNTWPNDNWPPAFGSDTLITTSSTPTPTPYFDGISYREYLGRIDVENFELDGNFEGQGVRTSAANSSGYKSSAFSLTARTGRLRNLRLRNFGSCGQVPYSLVEGDSSGIEAFPVFVGTLDDLTKPAFTDAPWVIEDVEVSEFRSRFGGYGTMFMAASFLVNDPNAPYDPNPLVLFRRCMVNGANTIGFGTAGMPDIRSGRIRFENCLTLNSSIGFNTDSYSCGPLTIVNSVFLDLTLFGMLGQPNSGPNHLRYRLEDNLLRLRGSNLRPTYADFFLNSTTSWGTDPNLALGRTELSPAHGLIFQGIAGDITFSNNWITTWPVTNFYLPDPINGTSQAVFNPVWVIPSQTFINSQWYARPRAPAVNVTLSQGRFSTTAFDFTGSSVWPTYNNVAQLLPTTAPEYTASRSAISMLPNGFAPQGRVERVIPIYGGSGNNLLEVLEAAVGQTSLSGTSLTVTVRAARHRTQASGSPGTTPFATDLWIAADVNLPNGATSTIGPVSVTTSAANGTASTTLTLPSANALVRLRTWMAPGSDSTFQPGQMAWSSFEFNAGTVVSLVASPDVADDKNTAAAKRAKLRFTRRGPTNSALNVQFLLPTTSAPTFDLRTPINQRNLIATYGNITGGDYTLASSTPGAILTLAPANSGGVNTLSIPAGVSEALVDVLVRPDNLTEGNVIRAVLNPTANYALGSNIRADVYLYDGPLWNIIELQGDLPYYTTTYESVVTGLNNGVVDSSGQYTVQPHVVGKSAYIDSGGLAQHGGHWAWPPATSTTAYLTDFGRTFFPQAVSDRTSSSARVLLVGFEGNNARVVFDNGGGWFTLPRLPGVTTGTAAAFGVMRDAAGVTNVYGFSSSINGVQRPVVWVNSGVPIDLAGLLPATRAGVARSGTDWEGYAVGEVDYEVTMAGGAKVVVRRGFRTLGGGSMIRVTGDDLPPPAVQPIEQSTKSYAVNFVGVAVGSFVHASSAIARAAYWPSRSSGNNSPAVDLLTWMAPAGTSGTDTSSEAFGINSQSVVAGMSGNGGSFSRAVLKRSLASPWIDLNDRHFVAGLSGWSLQTALRVNDQLLVAGNGTKNGALRAFVLVPRNQEQ